MRIFILFGVFILTFCFSAFAQHDAQYSQYMFNSMVINPGYAGYKEGLNVSLLHRDQWTGFQGAPKTQSLVIDGAFSADKNVGLGLAIVNDKVGLLGQTSAYLNYAYRLRIGNDDNTRLSFGLAAGIVQYTLNNTEAVINDINDPGFAGGDQSYLGPDGKFGIYFNNEKMYAGASVTNLMGQTVTYTAGSGTIAKQGRHYFLTAGYLVNLNESLKMKPSFLIKEDLKGPTSIDINNFFLINQSIWLGASYRTGLNLMKSNQYSSSILKQNSLVGMLEMYMAKKIRVGYAYDYSLSGIGSYTNGSHEISLGMILKTNKKMSAMPTPRYF
ncbi:MAG TPA: type IX secretion system membrane protein PorP/SprF [Sphingobacteriaceae bacterium]|nr:type IX secretion system membrane protein PorP/SprF [Sphingobacteriaceae bacterium]